MRLVYSGRYRIDLGTHVFPTAKYSLLFERLVAAGLAPAADVVEPDPASWDDLGLVHTAAYLDRLRRGTFQIEELAQLEVPWSQEVVEGFRLMTGGSIAAARLAVGAGRPTAGPRPHAVVHVGGGLHHAFADHGEGFCLFNDVAVAIRVLLRDGDASSAAVIDLDVHQGNGTAHIFDGDPRVFTFSMHQQYNYPVQKPAGSLDIGLPDATGDAAYLERLAGALRRVFDHLPDVAFYLAGADPYEDDQLGGLALTKAGLRQRDRMVLQAARHAGVPVVVLLAGGYARRLADTVDIHFATVEEAANVSGTLTAG
jgi:acetoin utilization deacetylase AcuC-like enzyme